MSKPPMLRRQTASGASEEIVYCYVKRYPACSGKRQRGCHKMLAYITIGTNDFQRSVDFYDAIFNVLGYSRLPAWTDSWAMWEIKIIRIRRSAFVFALLLTDIPQRRETGQCLHSRLITQRLSDSSMPQAFLQEGKMKAHRAHAPPMAPTFMWPTCAILTGISWHAFVSIILPQLISSSTRNRRFAYSILRFCAFTAPDVK